LEYAPLLTNTDIHLEFQPLKLGKKIELKYIPFSELAIPWSIYPNNSQTEQKIKKEKKSRFYSRNSGDNEHSRETKILKNSDFNALKMSIAKFGLLRPFEVAEMQERLDFFYGRGKYLVIDGQRRYFAIREMLNLPKFEDEKRQLDSLEKSFSKDCILNAERQAQEQFEQLSIRNYILIPCIVFPYTNLLQMVRHSIEDKRFIEKPPKEDFELVEKMIAEGVIDLKPDDLRNLWKMRSRIEEEKNSIEKTLEELRDRINK
jgi:hypothetical protein